MASTRFVADRHQTLCYTADERIMAAANGDIQTTTVLW